MNDLPEIKYTCCFCNVGIEITKTDPAEIIALINFDKPENQQYSQNLFCHINCLREKLHDSIKMHFHLHNILDD